MERGKNTGPGSHVPKNLVSEEGGPKASEQQSLADTPTRDHTFQDLQTESPPAIQSPAAGDIPPPLPGDNTNDSDALTPADEIRPPLPVSVDKSPLMVNSSPPENDRTEEKEKEVQNVDSSPLPPPSEPEP